MVMALGAIAEAKARARAEGIEIGRKQGIEEGQKQASARMIRAMRDAGIAEADIQEIVKLRNACYNGSGKS